MWIVMGTALVVYGLPLLALIILIIVGKTYYDKRYKHDHPRDAIGMNADYAPTKEIFIDPRDGHKYQVYYNAKTGQRQYIRLD